MLNFYIKEIRSEEKPESIISCAHFSLKDKLPKPRSNCLNIEIYGDYRFFLNTNTIFYIIFIFLNISLT